MNITPIAGTKNKVFIKLPKGEKTTDSGLVLIELDKEDNKPTEGEVAAVSESDENGMLPKVSVGDYVYFNEWGGKEFVIDGEKYLVMKENDIHAKRIK